MIKQVLVAEFHCAPKVIGQTLNFSIFVNWNLKYLTNILFIMGKGDKKSKRGKIILGSYGVRRLRRSKKEVVATKPAPAAVVVETVKPAKAAPKTTKPKAAPKTAAKAEAKTTHKTAAKKKEE